MSAATPIEASCASSKASATSVVQSVLAFVHQKHSFGLGLLARSPRIDRDCAGKILIAGSDCAQVLPIKS
jgi:hypothetical protein